MKKQKLVSLLPASLVISILLTGCSSNVPEENESVASDTEAVIVEETSEASALLYGTVNLSYANFYYGELNDIEPETTATAGQYELASKVKEAGYEAEGMYDAVTSATKQKSTGFAATYFEEAGDGANILGIANANVAISSALYEDVQKAISAGTTCNNELLELVSNLTLTDTEPVEYKVINSDGTLSKTVGETTVMNDITSKFTTISSWGNYQFTFEGLELDAATVIGGIIETSDGAKYGLEHEDNLWLKPSEVSFCVAPFTEPHGNEVAYQRFADMQGKTITKFTYMIANAPDIEIPVNAFVNLLLEDDYYAKSDETVTYSVDRTVINYELNIPDGSDYSLTGIKFGRSLCDITNAIIADGSITLSSEFAPGKYTLIFEDATYQGLTTTTTVESGLSDGDVVFNGETFEITKDCGLTGESFIKNFESLTVNGEAVKAKGLANLIFDENGKLVIDAVIEGKEGNTAIFADGENEVTITSTCFPSVTFNIKK